MMKTRRGGVRTAIAQPPASTSVPRCHLCRCPVVDGGLRLASVDGSRLARWMAARRRRPLDSATRAKAWVCLFCVRQARFNFDLAGDESSLEVWWPERSRDPYYSYFQRGWMKACSVQLTRLSETDPVPLVLDQRVKLDPEMVEDIIIKREVEELDLDDEDTETTETAAEDEDEDAEMGMIFCSHCPVVFSGDSRFDDYRRHSRKEHPPEPCEFCGLELVEPDQMASHVRLRHEMRLKRLLPDEHGNLQQVTVCSYRCNFCTFASTRRQQLIDHYSLQHRLYGEVKKLICFVCNKLFANTTDRNRHTCTHTSLRECSHCGVSMNRLHTQKHHEKRHCEHCKVNFLCEAIRTHHEAEPKLRCLLCPRVSCNRAQHQLHMRTHKVKYEYDLSVEEFRCAECGTVLANQAQLAMHKFFLHAVRNRYSVCGVCGDLVPLEVNYEEHLLLEHGVRDAPPLCHDCGLVFDDDDSFERHVSSGHCFTDPAAASPLASEGETRPITKSGKNKIKEGKMVRCQLCRFGFRSNQALKRHIKIVHLLMLGSRTKRAPTNEVQVSAAVKRILHDHCYARHRPSGK